MIGLIGPLVFIQSIRISVLPRKWAFHKYESPVMYVFSLPYATAGPIFCLLLGVGSDYWSNLPCDWLSKAWAYSEKETENGPWPLFLDLITRVAFSSILRWNELKWLVALNKMPNLILHASPTPPLTMCTIILLHIVSHIKTFWKARHLLSEGSHWRSRI